MTDELAPPRKSVELEDPGAKELAVDESSDEHFSDASEGRAGQIRRSNAASPIPITRVERVDDAPAHGEVPGTDAYQKRTQDAVPDEVEIIPDGLRSRSTSRVSVSDRPFTPGGADRPLTPGGSPIPKTVVERIDDQPSHGEVPGTHAHQLRLADAEPDVIIKIPQPPEKKSQGSPTSSDRSPVNPNEEDDADEFGFNEPEPSEQQDDDDTNDNTDDDDGFGDFDAFEEGGEGDDDFGDFDDGFQQDDKAETSFDRSPDQPPVPAPPPGLPVLDFDRLSSIEPIVMTTQAYIDEIYPSLPDVPSISGTTEEMRSIFLSERSQSLWTQLVAPPPLQPPDWVRSRIRRLFLVSLGVPVDLDEILPASKQKKLILPSISIPGEKSPRPSSDGRNPLGRVKKENASTTSVDSSNSKTERKRKGPPAPPDFDVSSTTMLCATTDAALQNLTIEELERHVEKLKALQERAKELFEYWQKRLESALGDKDAFEQVIESLVAHAKKLR